MKRLIILLFLFVLSINLQGQDDDTIKIHKINKTGDKIWISFILGKQRMNLDAIDVFIVMEDSINQKTIIKTTIENSSFKLPELKEYIQENRRCFFGIKYGISTYGTDVPLSLLLNNDSLFLCYGRQQSTKHYYSKYDGIFFIKGNTAESQVMTCVPNLKQFITANNKKIKNNKVNEDNRNNKEITANKDQYRSAFNEMNEMLQGKKPKSLKRIVFLYENAFCNDTLNYEKFCKTIDNIVYKLEYNIKINNFEKYKTAGNWAAFTFLKESSAINQNQAYEYDFNDYWGKTDYSKGFVTKLLRTKKGNCVSFPLLYKILCDEMKTESYLAIAPIHLYIKHRDDNNGWTNVELTNGSFPRDEWIIQQLGISVEAIKSGIYMKALSDTDNVVFGMHQLINGYQRKYEPDNFTLQVIDTALSYSPNDLHMLIDKANYLLSQIEVEQNKEKPDEERIKQLSEEREEYNDKLFHLGYTYLQEDKFNDLQESVNKEIERQKSSR